MPYEFDAPDTIESGRYLKAAGTFHLAITSVDEDPKDKSGKAQQGFRVHFSVLEGTVRDRGLCTEIKKQTDLLFFPADDKDFASMKISALCIATGLMKPSQLKQRVVVELQDMVERQVVANLYLKDDKYINLSSTEIYHVDDPRAKDCPKCETSLALIPPELRGYEEEAKSDAPAQEVDSPVDLDDI